MAVRVVNAGIGLNVFVVEASDTNGAAPGFSIDWKDGTRSVAKLNKDTDGDGAFDAAASLHQYQTDGTYVVTVNERPDDPGTPPARIAIYAYGNQTADLSFTTYGLQDWIIGGSGNDRFVLRDGNDVGSGADGNDTIDGGNGDDFLLGGDGDDRLIGGAGVDLLGGGSGNDILLGGDDTDFVYGDEGQDKLEGGLGDDFLNGGADKDVLIGGTGNDRFAFSDRDDDGDGFVDAPIATQTGLGNARDVIRDFAQGQDTIDLFGIDFVVSTAGRDGFAFIGNGSFTGAGAEVRFTTQAGYTIVEGDVNGNGTADFQIQLTGMFNLQSQDFGLFPA